MTIKRLFAVGLGVLLVAILASPAGAHHEGDRQIRVSGVIVSLHPQAGSFLLQQRRRAGDRFWVVQINRRTEIEDDDDDENDRDHGGRFRTLDVGDVVRIRGRAIGSQQILAREIEIVGRITGPISTGPVPFPQPPFPPFAFAPEILLPRNGAEISTSEFSVIGRTFPGAQVRIDVLAQFTFIRVSVAGADVTADNTGLFTQTVRPSPRLAGATYTITVTAIFQGVVSPPTSIVVRQL